MAKEDVLNRLLTQLNSSKTCTVDKSLNQVIAQLIGELRKVIVVVNSGGGSGSGGDVVNNITNINQVLNPQGGLLFDDSGFDSGIGLGVQSSDSQVQILGITIGDGVNVLTAGIKGYKSFPLTGTILGWRMLADIPGEVAMELKKCNYTDFPTTVSITAAAPPEIPATDQKAEDYVLAGWTTILAADDIFEFSVTGIPVTITQVRLELFILPV